MSTLTYVDIGDAHVDIGDAHVDMTSKSSTSLHTLSNSNDLTIVELALCLALNRELREPHAQAAETDRQEATFDVCPWATQTSTTRMSTNVDLCRHCR